MASKNVKTIQLLNGDNINISPATDITSLYYDYDDNGVSKRKYVFDQWPVKFNLVSDEINELSTKSSTGSVDVKAGQTIQNKGEDILVSYVYQSILPGTNIYQLNASVYNLSNILSNYVGYTHFNTSLNALSNDIKKSFDTSYNTLVKNVSVIDTNISSFSSSVYVLNNIVTEIVNNVSTLSSSCLALDTSVKNINNFVKNINIANSSYPNIITCTANDFIKNTKEGELIPGMIYEIENVSFINRATNLNPDNYNGHLDKMYLRALSKNEYDHCVLAINEKETIYEGFTKMDVSNNDDNFYITYLKDANNNEGNFDFTGYISGENNYIMLYNSALEKITATDGATLINGDNNEIKLSYAEDGFGFCLNGNYNVIENLNIISNNIFINSENSIIKNTAFYYTGNSDSSLNIELKNTIMENTGGFAFNKDVSIINSTFINNIYDGDDKNIIIEGVSNLNSICVQNTYNTTVNITKDVSNVYVSNYYEETVVISVASTWYTGLQK